MGAAQDEQGQAQVRRVIDRGEIFYAVCAEKNEEKRVTQKMSEKELHINEEDRREDF